MDINILIGIIIFLAGVAVGFIFGGQAEWLAIEKYLEKKDGRHRIGSFQMYDPREAVAESRPLQTKPGGIFSEKPADKRAYIINRPTAEDIRKWNEDPKVKASKEAISESLSKDPGLVKAREEFLRSAAK